MTDLTYEKLESLPNEVLIELFEYIDTRDLYYGFWGLNVRINKIIQSSKTRSLTLERDEAQLISLFANQINRLVVNTWQDIDLTQFPVLQSLVLHQVTGNQLRQIRSEYMPNLVYLSTSSIPEFSLMPQLAQRIFSNDMPTVRYVDLGDVHVPYSRTWTQSPFLHSVSIRSTNPTIVPFILISCPNLVYLHVDFLCNTIPIFQNLPSVSNHPLRYFILSDPYHKLSVNHVTTLLTFIPNVRTIELTFLSKIPFIRLLQSMLNRLQYLNRFDCNIDDVSTDKSTDIETIQCMHPSFHRIRRSTNDFHFRTFTTKSQQ